MRAVHAGDAAFDRLDQGQPEAAADIARIATERNPLSVDPLFELAAIEEARGRTQEAEAALERAVELQPASAEAWRRLGRLRLSTLNDPKGALSAFQAAYYLDPKSPASTSDVIEASRAAGYGRRAHAVRPVRSSGGPQARTRTSSKPACSSVAASDVRV